MSMQTALFATRQAVKCRGSNPRFILWTERTHGVSSTSSLLGIKAPEDKHEDYTSAYLGKGNTSEIGKYCQELKMTNVCVMTDKKLATLSHRGPVKEVVKTLEKANVLYRVYDNVRIEPTDSSFRDAIQFAKDGDFDGFIAVGGGSVMDTCKAANLYASNPSASFTDYVSAPVGHGGANSLPVKPLIAVPTVAAATSHMTGTAYFRDAVLKTKAGIFNRDLRPTLAIVHAIHPHSVPKKVAIYSGLGLLCQAMEALTCKRSTEPPDTIYEDRPLFQGGNTDSDGLCISGLSLASDYLMRTVYWPEYLHSLLWMMRAGALIAPGADSAGLHLCHAMGGAISCHVKDFVSKDYDQQRPMIPHGLSVIVTAPAVFSFTAKAMPDRHLQMAECLGADFRNARREDAGEIVADTLRNLMRTYDCPNGLKELGYASEDVPMLVDATLAQTRLTSLCPREATEEDYAQIFMDSMTVY